MGKTLTCPRKTCGYTWNFTGKAKTVCSCPKCKTSVMVNQ